MKNIRTTIIQALDIQDLPGDLQEDVIEKTGEGIMQAVMIHAFMTLPIAEQHELMEKLDKNESPENIFSWLATKLPDFSTVIAEALARYALA